MSDQKQFWFIRHAESEGNAGLPTRSAGDIPLTERGHQQARHLAEVINDSPGLFVISPYIRTSQTAAPILKRFPQVPVETWPIEEYTYLPAVHYQNTTTAQRNKPAVDYFRTGDPDLVLGQGAESFNQLVGRVDASLEKIKTSPHQTIFLFSHGWFIRTLLWRLIFLPGYGNTLDLPGLKEKLPQTGFLYSLFTRFGKKIGKNQMNHFLLFSSIFSIPNCSILKFTFDLENQAVWFDQLVESHIPPELRGSHLGNR